MRLRALTTSAAVLPSDGKALAALKKKLKRKDIIGISAVTGEGVRDLCEALWKLTRMPALKED